jgi:hypothetical protein
VSITVNEKVSVKLEVYNGTYSIQEGWKTRNGDYKPNFCSRRFGGKDAPEKTVPVSVKIGDKETALDVLRELIAEIDGREAPPF